MSDSPEETTVDTPDSGADEDLFAGIDMTATYGIGNPQDVVPGQPEQAEAVETSDEPVEPNEEVETEESTTEEETTEPEQTVNFDGFSDESRSLYERLLKEGHVTHEDVERERKNQMFHAAFTRARMKDREEVEAIKAQYEGAEDDLGFLKRIREDPRLNSIWNKMAAGEYESEEDEDELVDKRSAKQIALDALAEERAKEREQAALQARTRAEKEQSITDVLAETQKMLGIDKEALVAYLNAEEAKLPPGLDPIESIPPEEWQRRLIDRHEVASLAAENEALKKQLSQKTAKATQSAKQSLPPPASVAPTGKLDLYQQTCADLGIDPVNPQVTGLGFGNNR